MKYHLLFIIYFLQISISSGQSPLMDDPESIDEINQTIDLIYNFEFEEASRRIDALDIKNGQHPANYLLRSMILYWRERPFASESKYYLEYEGYLNKAIEVAEGYKNNEGLVEEGLFYRMSAYSLLTDLYSEEGAGMKVLGSAKKAYKLLKKGFDLLEEFPDFYFPTGLYNYYRIKYPELHPFYKTFLWLFVNGDMELGLSQLVTATEKGIFTQREAYIYLFHIYLRYQNEPEKALPYVEYLTKKFPGNTRFKSLYVEALVFNHSDSLPQITVKTLLEDKKDIYKLAGLLFQGLFYEQKGLYKESKNYLSSAFDLYQSMDREYDHYLSLIYVGKARLAIYEGDEESAEENYELALKLDPFIPVIEEAEEFIKTKDE